MRTLTSDVSASLFYRVRFQDGVHTSVELCHACAYFKHNCEHSILNHAIIDIQENYKRRRLNPSRLLSTTTSTFTGVKRLRCRRESKERRFWTRPGRTSAWWNNFADQVVIPEESGKRTFECMRLRAFSCG